MEAYTGIDIIEVERIKKNIEEKKEKFLTRIYTQKEIEYCESRKANKYQSYAARFAAKEAVFKAISPILSNKYEISWKDIEVTNNENGRPIVNINNNICKNYKIDISISHTATTAIASVIATSVIETSQNNTKKEA